MLHQLHSHPQFTHRFFLYVSQISDRLHRFAMPNHTSSFPFLPPFLTARLVSMLWHHAASSTCRRHSSELLSLKQTVLASRCIKDQFGSSAMYQLFNMKNDLKFMSELSRSQGCSFLSQSGSDIKKQSFSHEAHSKTNFASDSVVQLSWSCKILQVATSFSMSQLVFQHDRTPELSSPVEAEAFAILQVVHEFCLWRILYYLYVYDNIHKYIYRYTHFWYVFDGFSFEVGTPVAFFVQNKTLYGWSPNMYCAYSRHVRFDPQKARKALKNMNLCCSQLRHYSWLSWFLCFFAVV